MLARFGPADCLLEVPNGTCPLGTSVPAVCLQRRTDGRWLMQEVGKVSAGAASRVLVVGGCPWPWCRTPGSEELCPPCWLQGKSSGAVLGAGSVSPGGSLRHRVASVVLMVARCAGGRGPGVWGTDVVCSGGCYEGCEGGLGPLSLQSLETLLKCPRSCNELRDASGHWCMVTVCSPVSS